MMVTLPLWLVIILVLAGCYTLLDKLFLPPVRWFFRARVNRAITEVNQRLNIKIQPFKLTRRQTLIDLLCNDSKILAALDAEARATNTPHDVLRAQVKRWATGMVPAFNAHFYFRVGSRIARAVVKSLYRVRLGSVAREELAKIPENSTIVFVMNHRSNVDYILVAFLVADRTALSYAVGEWAMVWPLHQLIRAMGAFFIRRGSKSPLYRKVLERYVQMASANGVTQALFPEGKLSRNGLLGDTRMGLIDYMLRDFDIHAERDVVFVPIGMNYDRVLEDRTLLREYENAPKRGRIASLGTLFGFLGKHLGLILRGKWHRFGYACVNFGAPVSARDWLTAKNIDPRKLAEEPRKQMVAELAHTLMRDIGNLVPILPAPLCAHILLHSPAPVDSLTLKHRIAELMQDCESRGHHVYIPRGDRDYAIDFGLRLLTERHLVLCDADGLYHANRIEEKLLRYYANSIAHLLDTKP